MTNISKIGIATLVALTVTATSCKKKGCTDPNATNYSEEAKKDDGSCVLPIAAEDESQVIVTQNITSNTTWTNDKVYQLGGRITVTTGATLTIEAGTVIKGEAGTGANATALLIARGGKLMAEGTATAPIIFTSVADEITPADVAAGNFQSPNLDATINGLWGGIIVLGNAQISASNSSGDVSEVQIEGIPTSDPNGLYGGTNDTDNSGVIKYVSIRHGGANIGSGNEINGLTLGGVGSGTIIDHVEVVANQDDGVEFFGGSVNASNIVVWNVGDDAIDTDQSWSGTLSNFVVITPSGHCFELDGPEGTYVANHTIKKGTVIASNADRVSQDLINMDDNSGVILEDIYITDAVAGQMVNRVSASTGSITFTNVNINVPQADLSNYVNGTVPAGITAGGSRQADESGLGWTWAKKMSAF